MINLSDIKSGQQKEIWHPCVRQLGFRAFPSAKRLRILEITEDEQFHLLQVFDDAIGKYTLAFDSASGMVDDFYYIEEAALKISTIHFYEKRFEQEKRPFPYTGLAFIGLLIVMSLLALTK